MARVELKTSWIVRDDVEIVQAKVRKFLNQRRIRIIEESDTEMHFAQGSQFLTRFLGGWFVPPGWLPKSGTIVAKQTKNGIRIRASIEESLGFGFMDPFLKTKYQRFFEELLDDLQSLFD